MIDVPFSLDLHTTSCSSESMVPAVIHGVGDLFQVQQMIDGVLGNITLA